MGDFREWRDNVLLREFERFQAVEPIDKGLGPRAPLPEDADLPFNVVAKAHDRLLVENQHLRQQWEYMCNELKHRSGILSSAITARDTATREAKRNRRAFVMATWTAAFLLLVAILEGAELWGMWPR